MSTITCYICRGTGKEYEACPDCNGKGFTWNYDTDMPTFKEDCRSCAGTGDVEIKCRECRGDSGRGA